MTEAEKVFVETLSDGEPEEREEEALEEGGAEEASPMEEQAGSEALAPWVEFVRAFPQIESVEALPEEVLQAIDGGAAPAAAMQAFEVKRLTAENEQLRAALDALERNERNRQKSTGSMLPDGGNGPADPFLMGLM